jgi:hypothetical protein
MRVVSTNTDSDDVKFIIHSIWREHFALSPCLQLLMHINVFMRNLQVYVKYRHERFHLTHSIRWLVITMKLEAKYRHSATFNVILYFTEVACFLNIFSCSKFEDPVVNATGVAPTSEVCTSVM